MMFAIINTVYLKKKNISVVSIEHFLSHKKKFVKQLKTITLLFKLKDQSLFIMVNYVYVYMLT
jgi:hypothetical protein